MIDNNVSVGKLLITYGQGRLLTLLFQGGRLIHAEAEPKEGSLLGNIYIGKVKNIVPNIQAAFVEIEEGLLCFLPEEECRKPILTNRVYDGRLLIGDELLVQVAKEAVKTKQPGVTAAISLAGHYCVAAWDSPGLGISNKLPRKKREELWQRIHACPEIASSPYGIVIRTNAGELEDDAALFGELRSLTDQLDELIRQAAHRTCFTRLRTATRNFLLDIRDTYEGQFEEILTDDEAIYAEVKEFLDSQEGIGCLPLRLYRDEHVSLWRLYGIESKLKEALAQKVWLRSGGYLIIEPTEALTVIDVNSGKYAVKASGTKFGARNAERGTGRDPALRLNLEAADEIALQIRLRNLSGIIIVDFINMERTQQRQELLRRLTELFRRDPVRTELIDMTPLGLVEITRKKTRKPLREQLRA